MSCKEALGYQIQLNTELEWCHKINTVEFEFGGTNGQFLPKNQFAHNAGDGANNDTLFHTDEATGYRIQSS